MSNKTATALNSEVSRGRGRPKSAQSVQIERQFAQKGYARVGLRDDTTPETLVRTRLHNTARRLGLRITTERIRSKGTTFIHAAIVPSEEE